ncbi:MAG TPA: DUF2630 family protein [Acidimicrobiia bacterium]|jgi:Rad3-related DNA helicase|nr:DUF2630 family protein [Acidimicrobiia bacterium]
MTAQNPNILSHIGELVDEEHQLRRRHEGTKLDEEELARLKEIETELDQCWDLLNQRRALHEFGMDEDSAAVRDEDTVEGYQQ